MPSIEQAPAAHHGLPPPPPQKNLDSKRLSQVPYDEPGTPAHLGLDQKKEAYEQVDVLMLVPALALPNIAAAATIATAIATASAAASATATGADTAAGAACEAAFRTASGTAFTLVIAEGMADAVKWVIVGVENKALEMVRHGKVRKSAGGVST